MGEPRDVAPLFLTKDEEHVILTRSAYEHLLGLAARASRESVEDVLADPDEDAEDIRLGEAARAAWISAGRPVIPLAVLRRVRAGDTPLRAFRQAANLSQEALAATASIAQSHLSDLERGRRKLSKPEIRDALANALAIHPSVLTDEAFEPNRPSEPAPFIKRRTRRALQGSADQAPARPARRPQG